MTQQYTPVTWQDETTSQQGTLINAERLNQMQQAHHYADGFEEVDAIPAADPGVAYHKVVYCTADSTFYRWDGTEWTKDIDDETKQLLEQEIARATEAEGELAQDLADETTARETADSAMQADISALQSGKLDKKTTAPNQTQVYGIRGSSQIMINAGFSSHGVPMYGIEDELLAKMPTISLTENTVVNYGWATAQIGAEATARAEADTLLGDRITAETTARGGADTALGNRITAEETRATQAEQANAQAIANTYTKAETDTLLAAKADQATTYTKTETDTLLALKADSTALATKLDTLSTTGLHAYTHNGATQSEVAVIDGTTASTIPIRDANGRLQAADPASGATDKSLVTANWVSQTGDNSPNNLVHKYGAETIHDDKSFTNPIKTKFFLCNRFSITPQNSQYWVKVYTYNNSSNFAVPSFTFIAVTREHSDIVMGTVQLNKTGETVQSVTIHGLTNNASLKPYFVVTSESAGEFTLWFNCDWYTGGLRANVLFSLASNYAMDNVTSMNGGGAPQQGYDISETGYTDENGITHTFLAYAVMS